jgi:hypothetical protein
MADLVSVNTINITSVTRYGGYIINAMTFLNAMILYMDNTDYLANLTSADYKHVYNAFEINSF